MTDTFENQMVSEAEEFGLTLSREQTEQLFMFYEMLMEKNKVMNLTAITEEREVVTKHFSDSLSIVRAFRGDEGLGEGLGNLLSGKKSVIDVGTGAGFPGIPLKIVFPGMKLTLLDSLNKRVKFLQEACSSLKLTDVQFVHGRAEDIGRMDEHREKYDLCVSRAVANLSSLSEYCLPFVKVGGYFAPYKSGNVEEEMEHAKRAIGMLGGKIRGMESFMLPGTDVARTIIRIEKVKAISKKFPRKAGIPGKEPL